MHVLMTGATGFVGTALCRALVERGCKVTGVRRRAMPVSAAAARPNSDTVIREVGPATHWIDLLSGVDGVVHLAACVHIVSGKLSASAHQAVNAAGTAALAEQAAIAGVRRFLFVSTAKVHGEASRDRPIREDDPAAPADSYAESKWAGEEALRRIGGRSDMEIVVVRPPLVYGPGVKANFLRLMEAIRRGAPLPIGLVRNRRSLVYLGNLVAALERCLLDGRASGEAFLVCDGPAVSTADLARQLGSALGRPARLLPVPPALLRMIGAATGRTGVIRRLTDSFELDGSKIEHVLRWQAPYSMEQGMMETAQWFRTQYFS